MITKSLDCLEETVSRNIDVKGDSSEGTEEVKRMIEQAFFIFVFVFDLFCF